MPEVSFIVYGLPRTKGSLRAFTNPKTGKAIVTEGRTSKQRDWAADVGQAAADAMAGQALLSEPLAFFGRWTFPPPQQPQFAHPATKQFDLDKLTRSVWDALTNRVWDDDGRVVEMYCGKRYVGHPDALERPGVQIVVRTLT